MDDKTYTLTVNGRTKRYYLADMVCEYNSLNGEFPKTTITLISYDSDGPSKKEVMETYKTKISDLLEKMEEELNKCRN